MNTRKMTILAMLIAISMVLSYLESFLPQMFIAPGMKLGLANIPVIFTMYKGKLSDAVIVSAVRVFLIAMIFQSFYSFLFSFSGALFSILLMYLCRRSGIFSVAGVSVTGGVAHNIGQIAVAALVIRTPGLLYYLPVLIIAGIIAGMLIGLISAVLIKRIKLNL